MAANKNENGEDGGDVEVAKSAEVDNAEKNSMAKKRGERGVKKRKRNGLVGTIPASKRVRDLRRQLERFGETMPPGARKAKETELASMRALTGERARRQKELENAKKYRMVKFFDRKKIERRLKSEDENVRLQAARDYRYITEYPRDKKYLALFPKEGHTEESRKKVEEMRKIIEGGTNNAAEEFDATEATKEEEGDTQDDFFLAA